ncbi:hypothetical protein CH063_11551, partial [Colletotrichum higginsianum]
IRVPGTFLSLRSSLPTCRDGDVEREGWLLRDPRDPRRLGEGGGRRAFVVVGCVNRNRNSGNTTY